MDRGKAPLTIIIPCFNEERNIEACIKSALWAEQVLIVDSFSTDKTLEIARRYTPDILQHEYVHSAAQKNWIIPQAKYEWAMILDSDERITPELQQEIRELLARGPDHDGYWISRDNFLFGKHVRHSGWGRDSVLRLFRRDLTRYEMKRVHAEIQLTNTGSLRGRLQHFTVASITAWVAKINRYSSWKAQDKFEKGIPYPLLHVLFRPPLRFLKDYVLRLGVLDGWRGFLVSTMAAFSEFVLSCKILELDWNHRDQNSGGGSGPKHD